MVKFRERLASVFFLAAGAYALGRAMKNKTTSEDGVGSIEECTVTEYGRAILKKIDTKEKNQFYYEVYMVPQRSSDSLYYVGIFKTDIKLDYKNMSDTKYKKFHRELDVFLIMNDVHKWYKKQFSWR